LRKRDADRSKMQLCADAVVCEVDLYGETTDDMIGASASKEAKNTIEVAIGYRVAQCES
jgi:hypothetical protein